MGRRPNCDVNDCTNPAGDDKIEIRLAAGYVSQHAVVLRKKISSAVYYRFCTSHSTQFGIRQRSSRQGLSRTTGHAFGRRVRPSNTRPASQPPVVSSSLVCRLSKKSLDRGGQGRVFIARYCGHGVIVKVWLHIDHVVLFIVVYLMDITSL